MPIYARSITFLASAFAAIHAQYPDVTLTVAGSNVPSEIVRQSFPDSAQPGITVCPPLTATELAELYATHDIFVLPSLYEGFGMVFLEAMVAGMAVVGSDTGGMPDIIEHGSNGFIVPRRDIAGLRDTLIYLLHNDALRLAVGEHASAKATQYTWERAASHTAMVYQELVERVSTRTSLMPVRMVSP